jgi:hypothetical protein
MYSSSIFSSNEGSRSAHHQQERMNLKVRQTDWLGWLERVPCDERRIQTVLSGDRQPRLRLALRWGKCKDRNQDRLKNGCVALKKALGTTTVDPIGQAATTKLLAYYQSISEYSQYWAIEPMGPHRESCFLWPAAFNGWSSEQDAYCMEDSLL